MTNDTCGPTSPPPYEPFAQWSASSKTWTDTGLWGLMLSLETLPKWGVLHGGELYELPTPVPPTAGHASSSLLPSPISRDHKEQTLGWTWQRDGVTQEETLPRAITALLPTPTATDTPKHAGQPPHKRVGHQARITDVIEYLPHYGQVNPLLPTPTVMDMGANYTPQEWAAWKDRQREAHGNGNGHGASLTQEALTLLPTPTAQAAKHGETPDTTADGFGSNLWDMPTLIGVSTAQLSDGGKPSPDPHLIPLPLDETTDPDSTHDSWNG